MIVVQDEVMEAQGQSENDTETHSFRWQDALRALWYFVEPTRVSYTVLIVALSAIFFYDFVPAWAVGKIVDHLSHGHDGASPIAAYQLALFVGISYILVALTRQQIKNRLGKIAVDVQYRARVDGFARLMDYSLTWHQTENTGNRMQRITNGTSHLRALMTLITRDILSHLVIIAGTLIIFMTFGGWFILLAAAFGALFVGNEWYFYHRNRRENDAYNRALERSSGTYYESTSNILTIKSLGVKDSAQAQVVANETLARKHALVMRDLTTAKWGIFQSINGLTYLILLVLVISRVSAGFMTTGTILVLFSYMVRLAKSAGDTGEITVDAVEHTSAIGRMMPIYWDALVMHHGTKPFPSNWQTIEITDGAFRYRGTGNAFHFANLQVTINRHEKIGIVGVSGSGKSTLAKLLLGLYDLESGSFTIGGINYYQIRREQVTRHITTVLQETELFNLSLRDNLTLYREIPTERLAQAIEIAQLAPVIHKLPQGVDTLIGEKGYRLSGGERQRVGFARAICSDADILIFDEATAALDSKTEERIQRRLETELTDKTLILIAHRLSTLKHVDRILVFEDGMIVEEGKFQDLLKQKSRFREMYELQAKQAKTKKTRTIEPESDTSVS